MNLPKHFHILIVEDNAVVAETIRHALEELGLIWISVAYDAENAKAILQDEMPDLALLDIDLKGEETGVDLARLINAEYRIPFIFLTAFSDDTTLKAIKETLPAGYVTKPFHKQQLKAAVELAQHTYYAVIRQHWTTSADVNEHLIEPLTSREMELLELICQGIANRDMADRLSVSINTIKSHLKNLYAKMAVSNRAELILKVQALT